MTELIGRFIAGDPAAAAGLAALAPTATDPELLVAAALAAGGDAAAALLDRASAVALSTRDRQLVVIAAAHLAGDAARVDVLAREHLSDHPGNVLVAWIASAPSQENP